MTTIGAYFDALAVERLGAKSLRGHWIVKPSAQRGVLFGIDILVIIGTAFIAAAGRGFLPFRDPVVIADGYYFVLGVVAATWLIALAIAGAYSTRHLRAGATEYNRVITGSVGTAGALGIGYYLFDIGFPRGMFVIWFATGTVGLILMRCFRRQFMHTLHRRGLFQTPVLVAGSNHHVDAIANVLRREQWLGYRVVGAATREQLTETSTGLPVLGSLNDVVEVIAEHNVDAVIFAEGSFDTGADFRRLAWRLEEKEVQMIVVPTLADVSSQRLDVRPVAGLPLVDVERPQAIEAARWVKRTADILGASLVLLLLSPLMLGAVIAIKLQDGGPVIFRQRRVGMKGEEFDCLKFRSMVVDAEQRLADLQAQNEGAGVLFKMTADPRITPVGRFLRRFSIDELPQLWNTLRGDMSLVGPRPALPREVAQYDSDTMRRLDVRPGLTGLWQVSGRSNLSWEDTVRLDLYYVDNWSMTQDLMILARTAKAVVGSDGAY